MATQNVPPYEVNSMLENAINGQAHVTVTRKSGSELQLLKAKFKPTQDKSIQFEGETLIFGKEDIAPNGEIALTFRKGRKKIVFNSRYTGGRIEWPESLLAVPRRAFERQETKESIAIRFHNDEVSTFYGQLMDLSCGGFKARSCTVPPEGSYLCAIETAPQITAEAILKRTEPIDDKAHALVFQFIGLEFSPPIFNKMMRISNQLRRRYGRKYRRPS